MNHGVSGYKNHGCRCDVCRDATRVYDRQRRARKLARPARVGRLQVECLCGRGYCWLPPEDIGKRTGPCSRLECRRLHQEAS